MHHGPCCCSHPSLQQSRAQQCCVFFRFFPSETQNSSEYACAKSLLAGNDLEGCLEMVEGLLKRTIARVGQEDSLNAALGPLYYLYGTTLLYTVEDSTDMAAMMGPEDREAATEAMEADKEIAWQNLESSRTIIENFLEQCKLEEDSRKNVSLDLSMVFNRLGDLSRHNGHFKVRLLSCVE